MKKILFLTASPERDKIIDSLIAEELTRRGFKIKIAPCLREGRKAVLEFKPNVVVIAPIRNTYSRDFVEVLKGWGIGVVTRHTEASCDWQDWKVINKAWRQELLGRYKYYVDAEIVWGEDEAQILRSRRCPFPIYAVGAFALDIYFRKDLPKRFGTREKFNEERGLDNNKKTLVIGSPWGFADSAPDLQIPEIPVFNKDVEWRTIQLNMIKKAKEMLGDKWNILMRPHPGVLLPPYEEFAKENRIPLDKDTEAPKNWWLVEDTPMSQISPIFKEVDSLLEAVKTCKKKSNANKKALRRLETGRYGIMDGKATKRSADIISKIEGKFKFAWPKATVDYDQLSVFKNPDTVLLQANCGICGNSFVALQMVWLKKMAAFVKLSDKQKFAIQAHNSFCPWCSAKFFRPDMTQGIDAVN
jgi:hypothetical protein